ncbi:hypothetical protein CI238_07522 [Colletotrichum incanum]|uniref:Cyclase n=1 Tax=Colletotrichum incanum TaxID=1573173 RepID=A0A161VU21_COLIC|nr:hypothetical protein CI238_07522 [Colletotrichum incanum]
MSSASYKFPRFDELPRIEGQPQGCLWGFFDRGGEKDQLGTLNLLTADVVVEASKEIKTGAHVQLDWSLNEPQFPGFGRPEMKHHVKEMSHKGFIGLDDEIHINTQTSSQWDSLKHFSIQEHKLFYNGMTLQEALDTPRNGLHRAIPIDVCARGGIVGRGILVDWLRWWEHQNPGKDAPSATNDHIITVSEIQKVLQYQSTTCRQGDILIVRTGYVRWHKGASTQTRSEASQQPNTVGVANNMETVKWLYEQHFAAVAADNPAFEATPIPDNCRLHEWLLCQWGTHIGELWDLESLSQTCGDLGRWSFFFTSAPLNVTGGVASPPCAIATF